MGGQSPELLWRSRRLRPDRRGSGEHPPHRHGPPLQDRPLHKPMRISEVFRATPQLQGVHGRGVRPSKESCGYICDDDTVGVVMDMERGDLSFVLNGMNLGVALSGIPSDEPLVPCAVLTSRDSAIEFVY